MNEDLLKIHNYVVDLLKFAEAKNIALLVFNAGALGFIGRWWNSLYSGPLSLKFLVGLSVCILLACIVFLLLSLTTMFGAKLRQDSSYQLEGDVLSLKKMAKCTPNNLIAGLFGAGSNQASNPVNFSLAAKIAINSRSTEIKVYVAEKSILGTLIWILMLSISVGANAIC